MKKSSLFARIRESRLFLPLGALVLILAFDAVYAPGFFKLGIMQDPVYGNHLYGNLIDVLNDGAPLALVAIGISPPVSPSLSSATIVTFLPKIPP